MYGTFNQAILSYLRQRVGEDAALEIRRRAGVTHEFIGMQQYPDSDAIQLVGAAAEHLGMEAGAVLEEIGDHWVDFARASSFREHLAMAGSNLRETLEGLDDMHVRLSQDFEGYEPPSFAVSELPDGGLSVDYRSSRSGLAHLALGIIRALAKMFDEDVRVEMNGDPSSSQVRFVIAPAASQGLRAAS